MSILKCKDTGFQNTVINLINNAKAKGDFIFKVENIIGATKSLAIQSKSVLNVPGIYFLFCETDDLHSEHTFKINDGFFNLLYFGKAGQKKDGSVNKTQQLYDRINNVISDSKRGLKDVKRGIYWEMILKELNKECFKIIWIETNENCVTDENTIYESLRRNKIESPFLNKKLGRKK